MTVSVFIRARNEGDPIRETLQVIAAQTRRPDEVVVLDNDSDDDTAAVAAGCGARVCRMDRESFSYGAALNRALEDTRGDIIVFLSAHSPPVDERWLECLTEPIASGRADGTFGRQVPIPGVNLLEEWVLLRTFPRRPRRWLAALGLQRVSFSNANAAVSRDLLRSSLFREDLAFAEDLEWWKRVSAAGARVEYRPEAAVYHSHPFDTAVIEHRMELAGRAMKQAGIGSVYRGWPARSVVFAGTIGIDALYCLARGDLVALRRILRYRKAYFRGLYRGLLGA
ncbi:MAG: glycosyltransferase family 2 protein [Planctomycetota bacterium]